MYRDTITQTDGRQALVGIQPGERNGLEVTCIRNVGLRLEFETDLGPMERQGMTYWMRVRDLPVVAEELARLAELCQGAFDAYSTDDERAARVLVVAEGLAERLGMHLQAVDALAAAEVAPHEDTSVAGGAEPALAHGVG